MDSPGHAVGPACTVISGLVLVLLVPVVGLAALADRIAEMPKDEALRFLVAGLQTNLDKITSGKGTLVWTNEGINGIYLGLHPKEIRTTQVQFAFSGSKLRWDRQFDFVDPNGPPVTPPPECMAFDGKVDYAYVRDDLPGPKQVNIRAGGSSKSGYLTGDYVNLKYMMEPMFLEIDGLKAVLEGRGVGTTIKISRVGRAEGGLVEVVLSGAGSENEHEAVTLYFDPSEGFNVVKAEGVSNDVLMYRVTRTFLRYGDAWFVNKMEHVAFMPTGEQSGKMTFVVKEFLPNAQVADDTFNINGFGIPQDVDIHVTDQLAGIDYTFNAQARLDGALEQLGTLYSRTTQGEAILPATGATTARGARSSGTENPTMHVEGGDRPQSMLGRMSWMVGLPAAIAVCAALLWLGFRRWKRSRLTRD